MTRHMDTTHHDVVIVGGRVAGAAVALLLARQGHRVLVLDREHPGQDTLSTHALMRPAVVQLERWGLLDGITAAGTPPVHRVTFRYGDRAVVIDLEHALYAPRRTLLDPLLVAAATGAGAQFRFGVRVQDLVRDDDGRVTGVVARDRRGPFAAMGRFTVGADGRHSLVARAVDAPVTRRGPVGGAVAYGYWTGVESTGFEWAYDLRTSGGLIPTNDGEVCVWAGAPSDRAAELRADREAALHTILSTTDPDIARRVAAGRRVGPIRTLAGIPAAMRCPWGPGWALVGDAGYYKDPITAHGITDALRDAELLADALDVALTGRDDERAALDRYERVRDDLSIEFFDATAAISTYAWDLDELQARHLAISDAMKREAAALSALGAAPLASAAS